MIEKARWNELKSKRLKQTRGVSFEEIIHAKEIVQIQHPNKSNQRIAIYEYKNYIWAVPYVIEEDGTYFLKTLYKSRKLLRKYKGGMYEKNEINEI
ncbi:MAG: toxin [Candidatus Omnitrophica bacterium]|nr:toxin [Candidatus Omnitrophota bacterium]MDE2223150.1 toxin [Candidatus Omnitrophota bacterium]